MSFFIGFGSLVNTATHVYQAESPVRVPGWCRAWINSDTYDHAFLSVVPKADCSILGLLAKVPDGDWAELDIREAGYYRHKLTPADWSTEPGVLALSEQAGGTIDDVQMYLHADGALAGPEKPILYSYLETVLFGFYQIFGDRGVQNFVDTTTAWTTINDDRDQPLYPRHVPPVGAAVELVDAAIAGLKKIQN